MPTLRQKRYCFPIEFTALQLRQRGSVEPLSGKDSGEVDVLFCTVQPDASKRLPIASRAICYGFFVGFSQGRPAVQRFALFAALPTVKQDPPPTRLVWQQRCEL